MFVLLNEFGCHFSVRYWISTLLVVSRDKDRVEMENMNTSHAEFRNSRTILALDFSGDKMGCDYLVRYALGKDKS
jgi:hypothetical protein